MSEEAGYWLLPLTEERSLEYHGTIEDARGSRNDPARFPSLYRGTIMHSPRDLDLRSLRMHLRVAEILRENPALFERVRSTLRRWQTQVDVRTLPYLQQWQALVDEGLDAALRVAVEDSEQAAGLRQSSPFCGVLSHAERFRLLNLDSAVDRSSLRTSH